ncbi:MAG TPA: DNA mismatch repair protein MutS [Caulobacteraceae bacterium]|nr:DNA mismatch repair protein MutS [Caulobacteraceae bacterium]
MKRLPTTDSAAPQPASPIMAQYFAAKAQAGDALVFFRMGDFYELFFEDAARASEALGIALTTRGTHAGKPIPMAGVPAHAAESYLAKLIRSGFKIAVCEQMEAPAAARKRGSKAIVRRETVRIVTPGTLTEDTLLDARGSNRLAAVARRAGAWGLAAVELSTGEVEFGQVSLAGLGSALTALAPSEILVPERWLAEGQIAAMLKGVGGAISAMAMPLVEPTACKARLGRLYGPAELANIEALSGAELAALGLLAAHLEATQGGRAPVLRPPRRTGEGQFLVIDAASRVSLEIEKSLSGRRSGSLLASVDRTVSGPGARLLAARLARPLTDTEAISHRLDAVAFLVERGSLREGLRRTLRGAGDMARAVSRLALGRGGPRDLAALRDGLEAAANAAGLVLAASEPLSPVPAEVLRAAEAVDPAGRKLLGDLARDLGRGLADELPTQARDGGFVAPGWSAELDETRALRDDSRKIVAALESKLIVETGVALKIRHNAVLGYFVETTVAKAEALLRRPLSSRFVHRQSLPNQMRFTTAELSELDARIARATEAAITNEIAIFERWRDQARAAAPTILAAAEGLAILDVAASCAEWALEVGAVRPMVDQSRRFAAIGARHPVVEEFLRREGGAFTPNDCRLDADGREAARMAIVTGPNMAGKSTFLRQNALLVILAQAGSYVPAARLELGVVDRLFSRVGAGDDLARGRSTFMTEMTEAAAILTGATDRSFVILDEIGRGTATWDGLAIAWACAEALHQTNGCRTLFATHYHELAQLEGRLAHVANLSLSAKEWNGELVFLHEATPGAADRSYGVQVAKLAGVPLPVVARAREVLDRLERDGLAREGLEDLPLFAPSELLTAPRGASPAMAALAECDPDTMSPREALDVLYRLKELAGG